jgi:membrane-bound ClpP family serine protease
MIGRIGEVRSGGFVYVEGALWKAESTEPLEIGSKVEVIAVEKLLLKVKKLNH